MNKRKKTFQRLYFRENKLQTKVKVKLNRTVKSHSLSELFFSSGLDGDGEGELVGERRETCESWFFSMWTPLQISWKVLGGLAFVVSSGVFPALPLLSLDELMLTSCSCEPLLP